MKLCAPQDEFSEEMHGASHADEEGLDLGRLESMEDLGGQSGPARLRLCPHLTGKVSDATASRGQWVLTAA